MAMCSVTPFVWTFATCSFETAAPSSLLNLIRKRLRIARAPVSPTDTPSATMVKIVSLLALALVVSASGSALSAPVPEESTKETPSDLDANTPSKSKNIRSAEEGDGPDSHDSHDSEERGFSFWNVADDAADMAMPFLAKAASNRQPASTSKLARAKGKAKENPEILAANKEVAAAVRTIDEFSNQSTASEFDELARAGIKPSSYLRALLNKEFSDDEAVAAANMYDEYLKSIGK